MTTDTAIRHFIAVPANNQGMGIFGAGTTEAEAIADAVRWGDPSDKPAHEIWKALPATRALHDHVVCIGAPASWGRITLDSQELECTNDEAEAASNRLPTINDAIAAWKASETESERLKVEEAIELHIANETPWASDFKAAMGELIERLKAECRAAPVVPHIDPTHTAAAAILALDFDDHNNDLRSIATALAPHVAAAPPLPEYSCDDEWTAAEEAVCAAKLIVDGVCDSAEDSSAWWNLWDRVKRLRRMQSAHLASLVRDKLGVFPGFYVSVQCKWGNIPTVEVYPAGASSDLEEPLFTLPSDVTHRDVEMAILGWRIGHDKGQREGAERVRRGIRDLLHLDAA